MKRGVNFSGSLQVILMVCNSACVLLHGPETTHFPSRSIHFQTCLHSCLLFGLLSTAEAFSGFLKVARVALDADWKMMFVGWIVPDTFACVCCQGGLGMLHRLFPVLQLSAGLVTGQSKNTQSCRPAKFKTNLSHSTVLQNGHYFLLIPYTLTPIYTHS